MGISDSVRGALRIASKRQNDLAELYGTTKQSMSTKFKRESWFAKDLVKVADFVGAELAFVFPDGSKIRIQTDESQEGGE